MYFAEEIGKVQYIYSIFLKVRVFFCSFIIVNIPFYADIRIFLQIATVVAIFNS